jgi:hypothetical protein
MRKAALLLSALKITILDGLSFHILENDLKSLRPLSALKVTDRPPKLPVQRTMTIIRHLKKELELWCFINLRLSTKDALTKLAKVRHRCLNMRQTGSQISQQAQIRQTASTPASK